VTISRLAPDTKDGTAAEQCGPKRDAVLQTLMHWQD